VLDQFPAETKTGGQFRPDVDSHRKSVGIVLGMSAIGLGYQLLWPSQHRRLSDCYVLLGILRALADGMDTKFVKWFKEKVPEQIQGSNLGRGVKPVDL
jgi:hypothetical protein